MRKPFLTYLVKEKEKSVCSLVASSRPPNLTSLDFLALNRTVYFSW